MLIARGGFEVGPARFRSHVAIDRQVRIYAVEREAMAYDTRYTTSPVARSGDTTILYCLLSGSLDWHEPFGAVYRAPAAFFASEAHYEGAAGRRLRTFRSVGSPLRALEVRVRPGLARVDEAGPVPVVLGPAAWAAVRAYADEALFADPDDLAAAAASLLRALAADGHLDPSVAGSIVLREDEALLRVWRAIAAFYQRVDVSPSVKELASVVGLSVRHASRTLGLLSREFVLPDVGWREATLGWRLQVALLLLSVPELRLDAVARAVGYGRSEAMANAFQRAGLAPPRELRALLCADGLSLP